MEKCREEGNIGWVADHVTSLDRYPHYCQGEGGSWLWLGLGKFGGYGLGGAGIHVRLQHESVIRTTIDGKELTAARYRRGET